MENLLENLRFPIGRYIQPEPITQEHWNAWIENLSTLPHRLEVALSQLTEAELDKPYRPGGWTVRQVVHHLADSHLNAYCRIRLALTEEQPIIKPYEQDAWAALPDAQTISPECSLNILKGVHARWTFLLKHLTKNELQRKFTHPEHGKSFSIEELAGIYAHHGNNHLAQIEGLIKELQEG